MRLFRRVAPTTLGADRDSGRSGHQALQNLRRATHAAPSRRFDDLPLLARAAKHTDAAPEPGPGVDPADALTVL